MGAVLSPLLASTASNRELATASTLCGACHDACPVDIPLEDLLLRLRRENAREANAAERQTWKAWARMWSRPSLYRASIAAARGGRRALPDGLVPVMRGRKTPQSRGSANLRKQLRDGKI
jgi:L-lactate dehydrogenase complex protein LldF